MKKIWNREVHAFKTLIEHVNHFISYQLISSVILVLMISPLFKSIASGFLNWRGYAYFTNDVIKSFLLSPQGVLLGLLTVIIGFIIVLLQIGGLIILSNQLINNEAIPSFLSIFKYCIKRLKYMLGFDGLIVALYFVIIAPLLNQSVTAGVFESLQIPGFIMQVITSNTYYTIALSLLVVLILYLTCRWLFALHILLLEEDGTKKFLNKSAKLMKANYMAMIKRGIISGILVLLLVIAVVVVIGLVALIMAALSIEFIIILMTCIVLLFMLGLFIFMIVLPLTIIRLTIFYNDINGESKKLSIPGKIHKKNRVISVILMVLVLLIGVGVMGLDLYLWQSNYTENLKTVQVTAHRGSSVVAPENTLSAIQAAIDNKADHIEIDVQLTKDKELILLHDTTFKRTAGLDKRPDEVTLLDTKSLEVGAWFDEKYKGEPVPTLREVIELTKGKIKLNIEIKGSPYSPDVYGVLADLMYETGINNESVITSLIYDDLQAMEAIDENFVTGYIMFVALGDLESLNVDFYSVEATNINEAFVENAHKLNRQVHVWTINTQDHMEEMISFGVDNIITDEDLLLVELIKEGR